MYIQLEIVCTFNCFFFLFIGACNRIAVNVLLYYELFLGLFGDENVDVINYVEPDPTKRN